jgi:hypothetical protein
MAVRDYLDRRVNVFEVRYCLWFLSLKGNVLENSGPRGHP